LLVLIAAACGATTNCVLNTRNTMERLSPNFLQFIDTTDPLVRKNKISLYISFFFYELYLITLFS